VTAKEDVDYRDIVFYISISIIKKEYPVPSRQAASRRPSRQAGSKPPPLAREVRKAMGA